MKYQEQIIVAILLMGFICFGGCFSSNPRDIEAFSKPDEVNVTMDCYILQPADEIEIHSSRVPEIHLQRQQIRPDGKVSFELLGEVDVAGKTCKEVADILQEKVSLLYTLAGEYPVDVRVVGYNSKVYYVLGQVRAPGAKVFCGRETLCHALAKAQPTVLGWIERIQVIRPSCDPNTKPKIFELNYDRMIAHGDLTKDVLLEEGDIIYVPPTVLATVGMKVEEVFRPFGRAFSTVNVVPAAGVP